MSIDQSIAIGVDRDPDSTYHRWVSSGERSASRWDAAVLTRALVVSMRPKQWTKNLIIFFALLFTVGEAWSPGDASGAGPLIRDAVFAFLLFCALSGAIYLINDVVDHDRDRAHPKKRRRPVASGQLPPTVALGAAGVIIGVSMALSFLLRTDFGWVALSYTALMTAYSLALKRMVILDVFSIGSGFVLRAIAGAAVLSVPISPWLYICTGLGALVIALGKRRSELVAAGEGAGEQRDSLRGYSLKLINQLTYAVVPGTLVAYILYTLTAENMPDNFAMAITIPFVLYGLVRYVYLVNVRGLGENPEDLLISDTHLVATVALWLVASTLVLAFFRT
jgi:4-hydroxybenzoate polyprenyltransferase